MLQFPSSEEQWRTIADGFNTRWQFPNCIGPIDGKHIVMQAVHGAESEYYNYKGTQSIVLMAMVDAIYRFIYVDIGCNGRVSDGGVLRDSPLGRAMFGDDTNVMMHNRVWQRMKCISVDFYVAVPILRRTVEEDCGWLQHEMAVP